MASLSKKWSDDGAWNAKWGWWPQSYGCEWEHAWTSRVPMRWDHLNNYLELSDELSPDWKLNVKPELVTGFTTFSVQPIKTYSELLHMLGKELGIRFVQNPGCMKGVVNSAVAVRLLVSGLGTPTGGLKQHTLQSQRQHQHTWESSAELQ